ncbi:MAG: substrate-binding domain-containing protein [Rhodanobacteraceae bacterium]
MPLRPLRLLFTVLLLVFAADASLNLAAAKTTHSKKPHHHAKSSESESASSQSVGHACSGAAALTVRGDIVTSHGLVDAMVDAWQKAGNGCINVQPFNTLSGIDAALDGSADIAASARASFPKRAQEAGLTFTPVAWDALVMIAHPSNPVSNLTLKQLHDIYYGKITNWKDLGGKDEPIDLYTVASPLDGAEYSLRRLLYGKGDAPVVMPRMYINVNMLEQGVTLDPKALGLSTLSGVHDNKDIKVLPIEGVTPTLTTVADGSYPLSTPIYLASNPSSPHAAEIAKFMAFLSGDEAKKIARDHDLLPYPEATTLDARGSDQQITTIADKMVSEGLPQADAAKLVASAPASAQSAAVAATPQLAASNAQSAAQLAQQATATAQTSSNPVESKQAAIVSKQAAHEAQTAALQAQASSTDSARAARAVDQAQQSASVATQAAAQAQGSAASTVVATPAVSATGNPALGHAEAVAPSNPVVLSANGAVTPVQPPAASANPSIYTVAKGDTLSGLARKYSVSVSDLRKWNDIKGSDLRVGETLKLTSAQ